jgi:rod shape determining protein RodA
MARTRRIESKGMIEQRLKHYWKLLRALDWWMVGAMALLGALSVAFVFSATYRGADAPLPTFYLQQALWFLVGFLVFLAATLCDYRKAAKWSPAFYAAALAALLFVLLAPNELAPRLNGAKSWIDLRWFRLQPSEFAKIVFVLCVASFFAASAHRISSGWTVAKGLLLLAPMAGLMVVQPDMGMTAALVPAFFAMAFVAGARAKCLIALLALGLAVSPVVWTYGLKEYQKRRLTVFLNPERDLETMMGPGWNLRQSRIAVGSGGLFGEGYLQSSQKLLGYLPRGVVHNDFIFSVYSAERGFVGSVLLVGLYGLLIWRALRIGVRLRDTLARLMAAGVAALLFFNVFVNIGMTIGLMPITGLPLPLMSYGGSSILSTMLGLGLLQSAYVRRQLY